MHIGNAEQTQQMDLDMYLFICINNKNGYRGGNHEFGRGIYMMDRKEERGDDVTIFQLKFEGADFSSKFSIDYFLSNAHHFLLS